MLRAYSICLLSMYSKKSKINKRHQAAIASVKNKKFKISFSQLNSPTAKKYLSIMEFKINSQILCTH